MADINKLILANEFNRPSNSVFVSNGVIHSAINNGPEVTTSGEFSSRLEDLYDSPRYYTGDTDS